MVLLHRGVRSHSSFPILIPNKSVGAEVWELPLGDEASEDMNSRHLEKSFSAAVWPRSGGSQPAGKCASSHWLLVRGKVQNILIGNIRDF